MAIPILKNNITFSPYYFYTEFIYDVAKYYMSEKKEVIEFKLINENDYDASFSKYYIDPIAIPLLLSLSEQLKKHHNQSLPLHLFNNYGTADVLAFLYRSDFFQIVGNERQNPNLPKGKAIFEFNNAYLGNFKSTGQRAEHKVRTYSLSDDNLINELGLIKSEEGKRDYLIEFYSYKVKNHFETLLFENENTSHLQNLFIELLAELITNGVLHSKSNTFALMFSDRFKTKFSISDNGIGFQESLKSKQDSFYYKKLELTNELKSSSQFVINGNDLIQDNIYSIFETLYYSMLKDRKGLFDLMCNVVLKCKGYYRLHTDYCQIIISNRMMDILNKLNEKRSEILETHNKYLFKQVSQSDHNTIIKKLSMEAKDLFKTFYIDTIKKYNHDAKFSSIRIFKVKFRGVHVEVEIPNTY